MATACWLPHLSQLPSPDDCSSMFCLSEAVPTGSLNFEQLDKLTHAQCLLLWFLSPQEKKYLAYEFGWIHSLQMKNNTNILQRKSCDFKSICALGIRANVINTAKWSLCSVYSLKIQAVDIPTGHHSDHLHVCHVHSASALSRVIAHSNGLLGF